VFIISHRLTYPSLCDGCDERTHRPYYQYLGTEQVRTLCAPCARAVTESFTAETAIDQARAIIAACNQVAKAGRR